MDKLLKEQTCLLDDTCQAGMKKTKDILNLYSDEEEDTQLDLLQVIIVWAFTGAQRYTEQAIITLHGQLLALV